MLITTSLQNSSSDPEYTFPLLSFGKCIVKTFSNKEYVRYRRAQHSKFLISFARWPPEPPSTKILVRRIGEPSGNFPLLENRPNATENRVHRRLVTSSPYRAVWQLDYFKCRTRELQRESCNKHGCREQCPSKIEINLLFMTFEKMNRDRGNPRELVQSRITHPRLDEDYGDSIHANIDKREIGRF